MRPILYIIHNFNNKPMCTWEETFIHIIKQSPPPRLSVCLHAKNSKTTAQIFMGFSPIDRVILPETSGISLVKGLCELVGI